MSKHNLKIRRKDVIVLVLLTLVYFALNILTMSLKRGPMAMFKGVLASFQYGVCLFMIIWNPKTGGKVSIFLMLLGVISVTVDLFHGNIASLPGLFNAIFYLITLIIIARHNYKKEVDSKTDTITNAYNKRGLVIEIEDRIAKKQKFGIAYISLDNFKAINDGFGHAYGDELLRKIVKRLKMRFGSECIVARMGGAEFVVIVDDNDDVKDVADRLLETIGEKAVLVVDNNHADCYASCYAGVSRYPLDASDAESLIKHADVAMAAAMAEKSKEAYIFDESMLDSMNRQRHVIKLVKEGLTRNHFYLVYQPQYGVDGKKLRGFETLLRLKTDTGETVSPAEFIPIAEKSDLIFQIDEYVLMNAMAQFREIVLKSPELVISVNVSAKDFASEWFVEKIGRMLQENQFPGKNLEIEITEYCMVNSIEVTVDTITKLREMGVKIALDDFGTGYTSLDYVSRMPIDLLKVDKSLVDEIENDKKRRDFVHAVINMGQLMDCEVISEGVENESQVGYLKEYGCNFIQGFVWGKPLMYEDARKRALQ